MVGVYIVVFVCRKNGSGLLRTYEKAKTPWLKELNDGMVRKGLEKKNNLI